MTFIPDVSGTYDIHAPIDFDALKTIIAARGPYALEFREWMVRVSISVQSSNDMDVISIVQSKGFTALATIISRQTVESFESLVALAETYISQPQLLYDPAAEQQYIEAEIKTHLGIDPRVIYAQGLPEGGLKVVLSDACKDDPWRTQGLRIIFQQLFEQWERLQNVGSLNDIFELKDLLGSPSRLVSFMQGQYNVGFLTGRLISEYFVRYEIEHFAEKGMAYEEGQQRRNDASGKVSNIKRHQRVEAMLTQMEKLARENPVFARLSITDLADLAIEDAAKQDGKLWTQGKGRRDAYLDEMKSDLRYQSRFKVLQKKTG
ncbi:hypothetical protein [Sulfitobacter mediterraneus]|uniref:hypothetical protein n=1 Tax=Sulfitobacter mediterraneus TaxID=83219 RepID=UPI000EA3EBB4|nr:hypothetical protein [Sulfitobacter mediterraneus]